MPSCLSYLANFIFTINLQVGVTAVGKTTVSTTLGRAFSKMKIDECPGGFEKVLSPLSIKAFAFHVCIP
jgi:hypothetical protein